MVPPITIRKEGKDIKIFIPLCKNMEINIRLIPAIMPNTVLRSKLS